MAQAKTATVTLRMDPNVKDALKIAAEKDHRSITNMIEVLIWDHCERVGIEIPKHLPGKTKRG